MTINFWWLTNPSDVILGMHVYERTSKARLQRKYERASQATNQACLDKSCGSQASIQYEPSHHLVVAHTHLGLHWLVAHTHPGVHQLVAHTHPGVHSEDPGCHALLMLFDTDVKHCSLFKHFSTCRSCTLTLKCWIAPVHRGL